MNTAKHEVESLLENFRMIASLEDIQYHLYVIDKIRKGIEVAETQGTLSQEEVEIRLSRWTTKYP